MCAQFLRRQSNKLKARQSQAGREYQLQSTLLPHIMAAPKQESRVREANPPPAYNTNTPSDPPPAYSAPPPATSEGDDPYTFLSKFDTVFLIDDSGSMAGRSWRETTTALAEIAPVCASRDKDGIDVHFLNHTKSWKHLTSAAHVQNCFRHVQPSGGTPTGTRLHQLLKPYLAQVQEHSRLAEEAVKNGAPAPPEVKPLNLIVITDGVPSDDVESVIISAAKKLESSDAPAWQVGIQFLQVGNEPGAAESLRELDDELVGQNCPRDIVDTVPWNNHQSQLDGNKILKCVLGAVVRKLDRQRNSMEGARRR